MASKIVSVSPICPICLESFPVVKMLSTCKHVFCRRCLSIHLAKSSPESVVIPCPTCRVESPLPENGVDGLVDFTRDGADDEGLELLGAVGGSDYFYKKTAESEVIEDRKHCLGCKFKPTAPTVPAENICEDCGQLPMCRDCTKIHSQNKATQDHIVTSFKPLKCEKKVLCKLHDQMMTSYCSTCVTPVCRVCVMFEHGDHVIKKIGETLRELVTDVSAVTEEKKKQLNGLRQMETDLQEMKSVALGERDALVKSIEDHAVKCIENILNEKQALKAKVNADYKVIEDVTICLEAIPNVRQKLELSVQLANRMISGTDLHPSELEKLTNTRESLVEVGQLVDQIDGDTYLKEYRLIQQRRPRFEPHTVEFTIGNLVHANTSMVHDTGVTNQPESNAQLTGGATDAVIVNETAVVGGLHQAIGNVKPRRQDIRQWQVIFEHSYDVNIPSVANLGNKFAVTVGNILPGSLYQIYIYEFPGKLKNTMKYITDLRHIASTPEGNLAVLCAPHRNKRYVSIFNSEASNLISTTFLDYSERVHFLSFDVTAHNEYVILAGYMPTTVTVFRHDGSVIFSQKVREGSLHTACGGRFVFASRWFGVDAYEVKENQLVHLTSSKPFQYVSDISATPDGEVTVLCTRAHSCCLGRSVMSGDRFSEWLFKEIGTQHQESGSNISVQGCHVVTSINETVRVFEEDGLATSEND